MNQPHGEQGLFVRFTLQIASRDMLASSLHNEFDEADLVLLKLQKVSRRRTLELILAICTYFRSIHLTTP